MIDRTKGLRRIIAWLVYTLVVAACRQPPVVAARSAVAPSAPPPVAPTPPAPIAVTIAAGRKHTCALRDDGTVACWGENEKGQLGVGDTWQHFTMQSVEGLAHVVGLAAGGEHTCAWLADGSAFCWGSMALGEGGPFTKEEQASRIPKGRTRPVRVEGLDHIVEMRAGAYFTCARKSDGTVVCFGSNVPGGRSEGGKPVLVDELSGAVKLAVTGGEVQDSRWDSGSRTWATVAPTAFSGERVCALRADGSVHCVRAGRQDRRLGPSDLAGPASALEGLRDVAEIAGGPQFSCARLLGGGVACTRGIEKPPVPVPGIQGATRVAVGTQQACAAVGGSVWCWTQDFEGGVTTGSVAAPLPGISDAIDVVLGTSHGCARRADASVACWGQMGLLGDGSMPWSAPTLVPGLVNVRTLTVAETFSCAVDGEGAASCWGAGGPMRTSGPGNDPTTPTPLPGPVVQAGAVVADGLAGRGHCLVTSKGHVRCWGYYSDKLEPDGSVEVPGLSDVVEVSGTCARLAGGTVRCWTKDLKVNTVGGVAGARSLAATVLADFACAVTGDGTVRCWGESKNGHLGNGHAGAKEAGPKPDGSQQVATSVVGLRDVSGIAVGGWHACAWRRDGRVFCWGNGEHGQLGDGASDDVATPVEVPGVSGIVQVVAGFASTCARTKAGDVLCWGESRQFGPFGGDVLVPTRVDGLGRVTSLAAGWYHVCGLLEDRTVSCWGARAFTGMGEASSPPASTRFAQVDGADVVAHGTYRTQHRKDAVKGENDSNRPAFELLDLTTDVVPATLGAKFGAEFRLRGEPPGEPVSVTIKTLHPPLPDPSGVMITEEPVPTALILGAVPTRPSVYWTFGTREEMVPGTWSMQLLRAGQVLAEQAFTVVPATDARAFPVYQHECDAGEARSCSMLGIMYGGGRGTGRDLARAATLFKRACDGGFAPSCGLLAAAYAHGEGVAKNEARAAALLKQLCDQKDMHACGNLGFMYDTGAGVPRDSVRAAALYEQSCDAGNPVACGNLGELMADGRGVTRDDTRAVDLFKRYCAEDVSKTCYYLAFTYEMGITVPVDLQRATSLYEQGCKETQNTWYCDKLNKLAHASHGGNDAR